MKLLPDRKNARNISSGARAWDTPEQGNFQGSILFHCGELDLMPGMEG